MQRSVILGVALAFVATVSLPAYALEVCPEREAIEQQEKQRLEALNTCAEDSDCVIGCGHWTCDFYANKNWQDSMKGFYETAKQKLCYPMTFERVMMAPPVCKDGTCVAGGADKTAQ